MSTAILECSNVADQNRHGPDRLAASIDTALSHGPARAAPLLIDALLLCLLAMDRTRELQFGSARGGVHGSMPCRQEHDCHCDENVAQLTPVEWAHPHSIKTVASPERSGGGRIDVPRVHAAVSIRRASGRDGRRRSERSRG